MLYLTKAAQDSQLFVTTKAERSYYDWRRVKHVCDGLTFYISGDDCVSQSL